MSTSAERNARHKRAMRRKKEHIDGNIARATIDKGLMVVLTGNGKGKSSSAFGMLARSVGHGLRSGVVQFIKGTWDCGEQKLFQHHKLVDFFVMATGFTWETQDRARDIAAAQAGWEKAKELIRNPEIQFVLLDEINIALRYDYLDIDEVVEFLLTEKPPMTHVVLTGRNAKEELIAAAVFRLRRPETSG